MRRQEAMVTENPSFQLQVIQHSYQPVQMCYHCHTCTAGCPLGVDMQYGPDRLLRLIELGEQERVLTSTDIWLCASCETCSARCPNEIDVAKVMDTLRHMSLAAGVSVSQPRIVLFHKLYLKVTYWLGRTHEAALLGVYKLLSRDFFSDLDAGLGLVVRGKIPLIPRRIKGYKELISVYRAAELAEQHNWAGPGEVSSNA
jgi:heterodisulfide reductase subunit C